MLPVKQIYGSCSHWHDVCVCSKHTVNQYPHSQPVVAPKTRVRPCGTVRRRGSTWRCMAFTASSGSLRSCAFTSGQTASYILVSRTWFFSCNCWVPMSATGNDRAESSEKTACDKKARWTFLTVGGTPVPSPAHLRTRVYKL